MFLASFERLIYAKFTSCVQRIRYRRTSHSLPTNNDANLGRVFLTLFLAPTKG